MKILFNTMNLGKGGAERVINLLSNELVKENEIKIITHLNMPVEYDFNKKIEIVTIEKKHSANSFKKILSRISLLRLIKLKNEILNYNPDIIISFLPEPSFKVLFLKKICKRINRIPTIVSVRNDPSVEYNNFIYKTIMKKLYPLANQLVLQTNDSLDYFKKEIGKDGVVIYNPVDDSFLKRESVRKKENYFVAVGRIEEQKNYYMMVDAFKLFLSQNDGDYKLYIYGEGTQKAKLEDYIRNNELESNIILKGKTNNVKDCIINSRAFLMSSNYEGMPNSLLEAMCLGVPCISTNCPCGGPREILNNGECGILVSVGDYKEMANAMLKIINNQNLIESFEEKSKELSLKFKKDTIVLKWKTEIERVEKGENK